ncbi:EAL domain-containing protein [Maricurvus nonylphenolicus]|uniref:EAL domain-containing protein n=1 Tax=Maricurvus nonylphenolicus TaxID=1008307 RepID=UPI0036F2AD6F
MKVLVIDDSNAILMLLKAWLEERDYKVKTATSAAKGLDLFSKHAFDLVVCDVEMPEINGFEFTRSVRKTESRWTPIIFMSTINKEDYYKKGFDAGGDFYFVKPLNQQIFNAYLSGIERMHKMRTQLESTNKELISLRENSQDGIVSFDQQGMIYSINGSGAKIFLMSVEQVIGQNIYKLLSPISPHQSDSNNPSAKDNTHAIEYNYYSKSGAKKFIEMSVTRCENEHNVLYTGIMRDITERKSLEEQLKYTAQYDTLTGLPNRALFLDRIEQSLRRARRANRIIALLFIDLDRFKAVNDTLGHSTGDELLVSVADRLQNQVRSSDTVARLAGDEFVIILDDFVDSAFIATISENIVNSFREPFLIKDRQLYMTISIGVAISSENCMDAETLIKHADMAMYRAKESGRNGLFFYTNELNALNLYRMELSNSLNQAIENAELSIYFQPQVSGDSSQLVGAEALLRWNHPEIGYVSPIDFIPLLEDTGLIVRVTEWIFEYTICQWKEWMTRGVISENCKLSINLSAKHFADEQSFNILLDILEKFSFSTENLILEITESVMMTNTDVTRRILNSLSERGIEISLDDFGTGYSSLSYISQYPISHIKIDKSFVDKIQNTPQDRAIILAIINMAKSLNIAVTAEGVDTEKKFEYLRNSGCDCHQGFLFSRPINTRDFESYAIERNLIPAPGQNQIK